MSRKYKFAKAESAYFVSFASVNWEDLFKREVYLGILADSLIYFRKSKGIEIYAYVFMPNHVHFHFLSLESDPFGFMRYFKGFKSPKLIAVIKENPEHLPDENNNLKRSTYYLLDAQGKKKHRF